MSDIKTFSQIGEAIQSILCASSFRIGLAVFVQAGNVHELRQMLATLHAHGSNPNHTESFVDLGQRTTGPI
jgi:hypothetical protein